MAAAAGKECSHTSHSISAEGERRIYRGGRRIESPFYLKSPLLFTGLFLFSLLLTSLALRRHHLEDAYLISEPLYPPPSSSLPSPPPYLKLLSPTHTSATHTRASLSPSLYLLAHHGEGEADFLPRASRSKP